MGFIAILFLMTLFLAYSNGANDNFKGVATLYGSNTTTFRAALWIATIATFAGCLTSIFLAEALVKVFSGKGLVPDVISTSPFFLLAVAVGTASTVMLATLLGFPISTTHALTGALVGAGAVAAGSQLNLSVLGSAFVLPLLLSPLLSILLTIPFYKFGHGLMTRIGIVKETCVCIGPRQFVPARTLAFDAGTARYTMAGTTPGLDVTVGTTKDCVDKYSGHLLGLSVQNLVDGLHYLSGAAISFSRGLNDTPKIVGLLLTVKALDIRLGMVAIALAMAIGGLFNARKVAETMSGKISKMNDGKALTANLVTAFMVFFASKFGLPVSTTHVSVGSITGVGLINGTANRGMISVILLSWVLTLPIAASIAAAAYWLLMVFG
jgi:PiT family inorganic phosphate transporter